MAMQRHACLESCGVAGTEADRLDVVFLAGFKDSVPNLEGVLVLEVDFATAGTSVTSGGEDDVRYASESDGLSGVVFHVNHGSVSQLLHGLESEGPLNGKLGDAVGNVGDFSAESFVLFAHPCPVLVNVSGIHDQQVVVFGEVVNEEVIHDAALAVREAGVLHLARIERGYVVRSDVLEKCEGFGTFHCKFTHVRNVENTDFASHVEVFGGDAFILDRHVKTCKFYHFRT